MPLPDDGNQDKDDFGQEDIKAITDGIKQENQGQSNTIDVANVTLNAGTVNMEGKVEDTNKEEIKTIEADTIEADIEKNDETETEKDDEFSLIEEGSSFKEIFKDLGGFEKIGTLGADLYEGLHSLTNSLYVDGQAPNDWQGTAQLVRQNLKESSERRKENMDRAKDNWANNKANISLMADKYYKEKYLPEMQNRYGNTKPQSYIESLAQEKAQEKAKKALKDMSAYVQYGITDVNVAYKLYENANKNGFSPEQSIRNQAGYEKFNSNSGNVTKINQSGVYEKNNYITVEQAIPNAKTYYDAGYTKIDEMEWVDYIAKKLNKEPIYAMKVDETIKRKGKLSYKGNNEEMKKVIDEINAKYGG